MAIRPNIGETIVTATNKVTGTVQEVIENKNGTFRVRLDVPGMTTPRWTTVK